VKPAVPSSAAIGIYIKEMTTRDAVVIAERVNRAHHQLSDFIFSPGAIKNRYPSLA